ncbi:S-adenosyl-L-methionine-dependent methyltransferase [Pseudomassariella vexata]|uniref:S-adenosyl-L-methionine-dependent methyltransferase n=1 Tax=Pseudomassariella vexata TaxID=1141098 RepID=A0A1Y2EGB9_9PEZI|nr:S-adenosyl-L-methionine-dependent methyltransferase [Pseudomassariella vexata]ORY70306.1 S-adenosyl-L-methionine-dependent methyltransferase [Pseudomassariella vexata]
MGSEGKHADARQALHHQQPLLPCLFVCSETTPLAHCSSRISSVDNKQSLTSPILADPDPDPDQPQSRNVSANISTNTSTSAVEDTYQLQQIEPGSPGDTSDPDEFEPSVFDDQSLAASTSITSSVYGHSYQNGRRYHKYRHGRYPIPNDETEQNREDMLHAMMLEVTNGKLFFAPIGDYPQKILDLGTGTGIWAIEMGDKYASAEVTGIDLSPIQPVWVPPNVKFVVDDVEDTWLNGDNIDFVHLRNMVPILRSPVRLLREIFANLKPGGWVELQDVDGQVHCDDHTLPSDWPVLVFCNLMVEAFAKLGTQSHAASFVARYLQEAGFVNIQHRTAKLPYGTWPRDKTMRLVGLYYRTAAEEFFPAMGAIQMPLLGWSEEEMQVFFAKCRNAMRDESVHAYGIMHFWSAQRPES